MSCFRINFSIVAGGLTAVGVTLALAVVWIPSAVSSILQFRSGHIGSLRDKRFQKYREARELPLYAATVAFGPRHVAFSHYRFYRNS